jgi:hypothetical protein
MFLGDDEVLGDFPVGRGLHPLQGHGQTVEHEQSLADLELMYRRPTPPHDSKRMLRRREEDQATHADRDQRVGINSITPANRTSAIGLSLTQSQDE